MEQSKYKRYNHQKYRSDEDSSNDRYKYNHSPDVKSHLRKKRNRSSEEYSKNKKKRNEKKSHKRVK